ncbi:MAG: tRNA (adenosine(37)-N6)-dimethylallyltransferase MiaA [Nitrospirae bacterium]|nr:tRNA (adenosine(37)-N6)-dimethylallyltransferase MiaA [Nitrospirota bacterium]
MEGRARENRVLVITGPTGVGKTGFSLILAEKLDTEIISADSMQVYRGMDIGTAKPSPEERARVKHHMIDVVDPSETYSAGRYIRAVTPLIESLHGRRKIPVVIGGTGLYIRTLTQGLFTAPEADPELRSALLEIEGRAPGRLYRELERIDPVKAASVAPSDKRRIVRALEVSLKAGRPVSELQRELTEPLPYRFVKIGLTRERKELYRLIEERVEEMFARGLVEEVERLLGMNPSETPLQAIGYKEVVEYLKGGRGLEETKQLVKRATRRYAKRQFTWFRKEAGIRWVDITGLTTPGEVFEKVETETGITRLSAG